MEPVTPPPDREAIHLRRVEGGRPQIYPGRLERCPDGDGMLEASFRPGSAPMVRIGQHVELCYLEPGEDRPRTFLAKVIVRRLSSSGTLYRFLARSGARDGKPLAFTRRVAERAEVDDETAWSLQLGLDQPDAQPMSGAVLLDISATGAQALVPVELEALLYSSDRLRVHFHLTGEAERCELVALVRWRSLDEGEVRYGLQFVEDAPGFEQAQRRIAAYVAARLHPDPAAESDAA